jgi:hypothetical protein
MSFRMVGIMLFCGVEISISLLLLIKIGIFISFLRSLCK